MRIYKNDIIKASAISTGADRGVLLCSITDSGFTSIAGVISAVKDKLPGKDHKKMIFEIRNDGRNEYGRYNNCGGKNMKYRGLLLPMILAAMCGDDAFVLNTKRGKGMQSTYRREKIVRTEKEFDINGTKVMAYSRKDAIKRLKHKK